VVATAERKVLVFDIRQASSVCPSFLPLPLLPTSLFFSSFLLLDLPERLYAADTKGNCSVVATA
jgi:hypothetical protein